ncbi:MAG: DUF3343 domain-containing protein, partial [Syntrophorhabdaceae bacterium]|nr:DUF3343 domain-containing protein [Syntrophorhabdaceae bacterium]
EVYYFLIFPAVHDVIKAEKKLKSEKIEYELVPVPRQLSSDCGVCIKLRDIDSALNYIDRDSLGACYIYDGAGFREMKR